MAIRHEITQGDSVAKLAAEYGFFPETIWDHPENAQLKELRQAMNILAPGDILYIPDKREAMHACETGQRHVFRRRAVPMMFRLQLLDGRRPRANLPYRLEVDGLPLDGHTDGEGRIEHYIPNGARRGRLTVDKGVVDVALDFGYMDPVARPAGARKRLINLGYALEEQDQEPLDDSLRAALRLFQDSVGLDTTGELDDKTRAELARCHDEPGAYERARTRAAKAEEGS